MLDKTLPKGSTLEDARKVLKNWEEANPIKVKWKEGQKSFLKCGRYKQAYIG